MEGVVYKSTGSWYEVHTPDGAVYQARLRGRLKVKGLKLKVTNPIAVGDVVVMEPEDGVPGNAIIKDIADRRNYIIRQSTRKAHHGHIIAANLDQAILIVTLRLPRTSLGFIDRFLVTAEAYGIPVTLAFNKQDILEEEPELLEVQEHLIAQYAAIGYPGIKIAATRDGGLTPFLEAAKGKTSLLAGHSGVGKSTILNQVAPHAQQSTAEISTFANKGKHTTTFAEMFDLEDGTRLIDTPGIKELGLINIEPEELSHYFPEMREYLGACHFHNCSHTHEPGCAVLEAVDEGRIWPSRFNSYLSMLEAEDNRR